jgi:hypothetical protein
MCTMSLDPGMPQPWQIYVPLSTYLSLCLSIGLSVGLNTHLHVCSVLMSTVEGARK